MPRMPRFVAEGYPHHITQRGNRRQIVFEDREDRRVYLDLLKKYSAKHKLGIWAWCLMTNHIHLLAVPPSAIGLARALGCTHRDYSRYRNVRAGTTGCLWQARYYSCPVDAPGVWQVMSYIERNPVRGGLADIAEDYPWSSARAHVNDASDKLIDIAHWREYYTPERWRETLRIGVEEEALGERIRQATMTGRPFGSAAFTEQLEAAAQRRLSPRRRGRRKTQAEEAEQLVLRIGE
ncbi:MAG TPA: transposase [Bryobacteraceae bacterium]|nr:transposase [Bryobacteraceae bacterium]